MPEVGEILSRYVSNLDKNVYAIMNLPEEVIAVIFAYVSRSPKSFRENLVKLVVDRDVSVEEMAASSVAAAEGGPLARASEEARRFHEKWVVGYGHSSVAEHGVVHLGVERISRLASAALELASPFLSFTEYSQRYQRPERASVVVPPELEGHRVLRERFLALHELAFDAYERIEEGVFAHLARENPPRPDEDDGRYRARVGRLGFEDARYVLSLAVATGLGMTANGRALRDALVTLKGDPHGEVRSLASDLEAEGTAVLPTLVRHIEARSGRPRPQRAALSGGPGLPAVSLLAFSGDNTGDPLHAALERLLGARSLSSGEEAGDISIGAYQEAFGVASRFDPLPEEADHIIYTFRLVISEASWHQLLRHNRRTAFSAATPGIGQGVVVPPSVRAAGLEPLFRATVGAAENLYRDVYAVSPEAAQYVVTNAHRRIVLATLSLREIAHVVRVRGAANAQWDIRQTVGAMAKAVETVHPGLIAPLIGA